MTFRKVDLFPSSGERGKTPTQLGHLERANLNHWTVIHLRTERDPVSETSYFYFLQYWMIGEVQKRSNFVR
jgi:hypothetical protein